MSAKCRTEHCSHRRSFARSCSAIAATNCRSSRSHSSARIRSHSQGQRQSARAESHPGARQQRASPAASRCHANPGQQAQGQQGLPQKRRTMRTCDSKREGFPAKNRVNQGHLAASGSHLLLLPRGPWWKTPDVAATGTYCCCHGDLVL